MTTPTTIYGPASLRDLRARTEYEVWLLEAVYKIVDQRLAVDGVGALVYPPNGGEPKHTIYCIGDIHFGDWRPGFLKAGAPLVLVTAFKLLDMLLEWVLAENGRTSTYRFAEKIAALKDASVRFPLIVETRPWLRERLVALYKALEPLRGTIIHGRHFTASNGELQVSSSKGGIVGTAVTISASDLCNFAFARVAAALPRRRMDNGPSPRKTYP